MGKTVAFLLILIQSCALPSPALALEKCSNETREVISAMLGGTKKMVDRELLGYGTRIEFNHFKQAEKILLMGDAGREGFSMGPKIAEKFPDKKVVSTDFDFIGKKSRGSYTEMHMDNLNEFPFKDNSFDTIVLRRGLCICHADMACAGFCASNQESKIFFERIIRVLNKKNSNSIAILHGEVGIDHKIQDLWKQQLLELEAKYPVQVKFVYPPGSERALNSIVIEPISLNFH